MEIKTELEELLEKIVKELTDQEIKPQVEIPQDLGKGDFTCNVAFKLRGKLGNPMEAGERIVEKLKENSEMYSKFAKIELVNPGFINFWLSQELIAEGLKKAVNGFEPADLGSDLILEFGDLNPFKEPHIGHVRMLTLGESLARLMEFGGIKVIRANYEGDVGMHVAKCIWGFKNLNLKIDDLDSQNLEEKVKALAKSYSTGAKAFEENEESKLEIISINNKIYTKDSSSVEASDDKSEILEIWEKGRQWSLDYFEELYKKLGVKYEKYYFESEIASQGKEIVESRPDVFPKDPSTGSGQAGPYIFRGEDYGLHTRVFVNSEGNPTYDAKDLGLSFAKDKDYPNVDKSIIMTANEQIEYFRVLLKALEKVNSKIAEKTSHLSMGFVNLKEGKMSSRTGNVVGANWLLNETRKSLKEGFKEVPDGVLEDISVGAVKWSMLKFSRESDISFDISESIDLAGNSGPYMQYTYARICSVLSKAENGEFEAKSVKTLSQELLALSRIVCQFETVIKNSSDHFGPNILTEYLFFLAQKFNTFYEKEKIIGTEDEDEKLMVCKASQNVIGQGLKLLGIKTPEKI